MKTMRVTAASRGDWYVVSVAGRVDSLTSDELSALVVEAVAAHDQVAVDCSAVDYVSSAGLAALLNGARAARAAHTTFTVCVPSPRMQQVLDVSRLNTLLNVQAELPC